jgi:hypothetical protein
MGNTFLFGHGGEKMPWRESTVSEINHFLPVSGGMAGIPAQGSRGFREIMRKSCRPGRLFRKTLIKLIRHEA